MRFQHATIVANIQGVLTAILDRHWLKDIPQGGYLAAIALRAAGMHAPDGARPRAMSCQYLSLPKPGGVSALIEAVSSGPERRVNVGLWQDGQCFFRARIWIAMEDPEVSRSRDTGPETFGQSHAVTARFQRMADKWPELYWYFDTRAPMSLAHGEGGPRIGAQGLSVRDFHCGQDRFLDAARSAMAIALLCWHDRAEDGVGPSADSASALGLTVWFHANAPEQDWLVVSAGHDGVGHGLGHAQANVQSEDGQLLASGGARLSWEPPWNWGRGARA